MGIKDLWSVLTPYAERKPISELRGKKVAIDLAGWVCESLNVVDYFVHPRHHLKNLFFRTCYLIWEEVVPVFVLEGVAPKLKSQVIAKRNELQFRGVRPKNKISPPTQSQTSDENPAKKDKGRTRFNHVLKQCENLLKAMGIQCVQGPGEAEAYCAFLNKQELVDGVISQDSDCFAYGAVRVYRNFSVSTQGAQAAAGGAVDIYDMRYICERMDFGQQKIIVMALLCGCDYCPEGVGGIGKDSVLKLFNKYKEYEILERVRAWRNDSDKYNALELRVDDKTICSNCGHIGRTQSHTKSGCGICRTPRGCDETLWREQRLALKAELTLRQKALVDANFPSEEVIAEFLSTPSIVPELNLNWQQPNMVKFLKQIGHLLQWPEIYCFQKFFPILTRWQVQNAQRLNKLQQSVVYIEPKEIIKKRTIKGVPSLEIIWLDTLGSFQGLIPDEQIREYEIEHPKGIEELYCTVEPLSMLQTAFPEMVDSYLKSKEKPKKVPKKKKTKHAAAPSLNALDNINDLIAATNEIAKTVKQTQRVKKSAAPLKKKGLQPIGKFFKQQQPQHDKKEKPKQQINQQCSTPITKRLPSDLESDCEADEFDISDIINGIIMNPKARPTVTNHAGRLLHYEKVAHDLSQRLDETSQPAEHSSERNMLHLQSQLDDADLLAQKRNISFCAEAEKAAKRMSLDDSFDLLVKGAKAEVKHLLKKSLQLTATSSPIDTHVQRFKREHRFSRHMGTPERQVCNPQENVSYFFDQSAAGEDAFERLMDMSIGRNAQDLVVISDSE